ncbi:MAG: LPS-assembly protein LptD, partial [Marinirhabdus sp.]
MQTYKHFTLFTLVCCCLFCSSGRLYAQDIPIKGQTNIPARKTGDTLPHPPTPTLDERPEKIADTVKTDSLAAPKETLTDVVDYYAEDHVYINRKTNRVHLYNKAYIVYGDMRIDAGYIILDHNTNEVYAKGLDSAGVYAQKPVFKQAQNEVRPDSIRFNFDTEKALVYNSATEQSGFNVLAKVTKKVNDSVVYLQNVRFTTAQDLNDPEYYFYTRRAKFVPKKKIVTGLTNMYIYDVPTPIGLPFAYFPLTEDRTSGFIIPTVGEDSNRGFFFQNGGYYFAISD